MNNIPVITIDGPSAVGKGTVTRRLAEELNWHVLDSGSLYRVLALSVLKQGIVLNDQELLTQVAKNLEIRFAWEDAKINLILDGEVVNEQIRTEKVGNVASKISQYPGVRKALLQLQRDFLTPPGLIADGRDMGTVVFPQAKLKIFLTASMETRAKRRYKELKSQGIDVNLPGIFEEMCLRDTRDSERSVSPLKAATDAIEINTDNCSIEQVVTRCLSLYKGLSG